jgi:drug/metabolite transporter (DMT)-like permease
VATRETSIVFSVLIGSMLMGEGHLGPRLVGALIVLLGVACVAVAR